ncbi:unnamed protein product [Chrysodeixis includens]|uniref:Fatty acyl-CoA reductase n=1 Tax=Chrysodeixis includens TaxID=689277 RepID=A0A9P0BMM2_CHRIL|nr:unnamed protein product [Chrysodeixis includens]
MLATRPSSALVKNRCLFSGKSQITRNKEESKCVQPVRSQVSIADFYAGKSVFITGVTGFVGKVCVEKLLYSCKDIDKVFVLVRDKKDESVSKRIDKIIDSPVFVHVSTAYCNTHVKVLDEKVYLPPAPLDDVLKYLEEPERNYNRISKLYRDRPNTYTYAKALAESYVMRSHGDIPTVIVRPSIVVSSSKEPIPGWSDTMQGSSALIASSWKGLNRVVLGHRHNVLDFIPVDYVSNLLIAAAANCHSSKDIAVHNCCTSSANPLTFDMVLKFLEKKEADKSSYNLSYPRVLFTENKQLLSLLSLLLQTGPAYAADLLRRIRGKKPIYMKIQSQLSAAHDTLDYFTSHSWIFKSNSTQQLYNSLQPSDKKEFYFDSSDINWDEYFETYLDGIERFLLKPRSRN